MCRSDTPQLVVQIQIPEYVQARIRAFQQAPRVSREARQAGVGFLAGTDSGNLSG